MKFYPKRKFALFIFVTSVVTFYLFYLLQPEDLETTIIERVVKENRDNGETSITKKLLELDATLDIGPNYNVHVFYYTWYGNPRIDDKYIHWNHRYLPRNPTNDSLRMHVPPKDIGSNFYPKLNPYSSRDVKIVDYHFKQIRRSGIGVVAVSWYPPGMHDDEGQFSDSVVPVLLEKAAKFGLKICLHIEPYKDRNEMSLREHLKYIVSHYGSHPALYRYPNNEGRLLPLYYIYDSYLTSPEAWCKILGPNLKSENLSVRGSELDGIFVGLLIKKKDIFDLKKGGFDGFYTYFGTNGFTYGSTVRSWHELVRMGIKHDMMFIPSVAPGYVDVRIRPWNGMNTRSRSDGGYYEEAFQGAIDSKARIISITSFNEWHEGTQIEEAVPMSSKGFKYLDYLPNNPDFYLRLTKKYVIKFTDSQNNTV